MTLPTLVTSLNDANEDLAKKFQECAILGDWAQAYDLLTIISKNTVPMSVVSNVTTSLEANTAGLASSILLANALRGHMNTHAADGSEHKKGGSATPDTVNFPVTTPIATDLATLKTLCLALFTAYAAHDVDAVGGTTYHNHAANAHTLVSALIPATLAEAVARLNDLRAKYKLHFADPGTGAGASHTASTGPDETTGAAANGTSATITDATVSTGDKVCWSVLSGGAGPKTGVSAVAGSGCIVFTMSADPVADTVLSYSVFRA